ncbi:hypothetical protein [Pseudonocardia acaciae]|uniref:hypothetical protein n=1 Tax=Pseudonocardia acaciae TaxID=551276 RepID=UPI000A740538|nr:hypothetical protein [Pseudonocardia acaciae]
MDAEIDELREYVLADDETDAAEVDQRTGRIKALLESVKTSESPALGDGTGGSPGVSDV